MFATSNNKYILSNAAGQLALNVQAFFMSAYIVVKPIYRYPCTPVWSVNAPTDKTCIWSVLLLGSGTGTDTFFCFICLTIHSIPTPHCLAATERRPTKRVFNVYLLLFPTFTRRISGIRKTGLPGFLISPAGKLPWGQPLYPN